ncbi:NYN domain-containing protein [Novosphingobium sp. MW5]|nr:NYN domain-containing protein [Novosphingobium sp. MW5]
MFYKDERLALFIDGANLFAAGKALGFDIDYKLLRQEFMRRGKMLRAFYYTALLENDDYSPILPAHRLAELQRLHDGDQARQGIHRFHGPP